MAEGNAAMEKRAERQRLELRLIKGGFEEARCVGCGENTGIHVKWWYDGSNELAPYCEPCGEAEFASVPV